MLKVLTAALKEAVKALEKFDNSRDAISPEEYFRVSLAKETLLLEKSAESLKLLLRLKPEATGDQASWREGLCVNPRTFEKIVRSLPERPDDPLELDLGDSALGVAGRHFLPGSPGGDFPPLPPVESDLAWMTLDSELVGDLAFTAPARLDWRYPHILNGIRVGEDIAATNARRIHCVRGRGFWNKKSIIPGPLIYLLLRLNPEDAVLGLGKSGRWYCRKDPWLLIGAPTPRYRQRYPDYHHLLDTRYASVFELSRTEIIAALAEATVHQSPREPHFNILRLTFDPRTRRLGLVLGNDRDGYYRGSLAAKIIRTSDEPCCININLNYFRDAVSGLAGKSIFLSFDDSQTQIRVTGREPDKIAVIMPIRLEEEDPTL